MTPAARVQAAIELLDEIHDGKPGEQALTGWARRSRFAGSKDRAAVRDHVFQALRCWRSYACLGGAETGRGVMIGAMRAAGQDLSQGFSGQGYGPAGLSEEELSAGGEPLSDGVRLNLPDWLVPLFYNSLGDEAEAIALALGGRAPVVLRVNQSKTTRSAAISVLAAGGITAEGHPIAESALVVTHGARQVAANDAYRQGLVELQDGSSQAAMAGLDIPPGAKVLDYCAGGGGKTLALAGRCQAQWYAHDSLPQRMKDLPNRAERAGVLVQVLEQDMIAQEGPYDLILCDVPCSGSGTWRRAPDAKWRLTQDRLAELNTLQDQILDEAAQHLAPGGVLAYATCSVLNEENEDRIRAFVARTPGWSVSLERHWPVCSGGDGFFIAHLLRG